MIQKKLYVHVSPKTADDLKIEVIRSLYAIDGQVYFTSQNVTLEDYASEWKNKFYDIQKRYRYLEYIRYFFMKIMAHLV